MIARKRISFSFPFSFLLVSVPLEWFKLPFRAFLSTRKHRKSSLPRASLREDLRKRATSHATCHGKLGCFVFSDEKHMEHRARRMQLVTAIAWKPVQQLHASSAEGQVSSAGTGIKCSSVAGAAPSCHQVSL